MTMKSKLTRPRHRKIVSSATLAIATIIGGVAFSANPAAAACVTSYVSTNGNNPNRTFTISNASTCNDLNFRQATVSQNYRGEYRSGSTWYVGSGGWIYRTPSSTGLAVAINNIANGTTVRATGWSINAYIYAVH